LVPCCRAPATNGDYASITSTNAAGNIDVRDLNTGSKLIVPVFNDGALLSAADGHALQGEESSDFTQNPTTLRGSARTFDRAPLRRCRH
jgi:Acetamidase/Formamidase family